VYFRLLHTDTLPPHLNTPLHPPTPPPQEFFRCDYFIDAGAAGLLERLRAAVDRAMAGVDFGGCMTPQVILMS